MLLYISPGSCALSPHIALLESGLPFTTEKVSLSTHKTEHGDDFYGVSSKGYVPMLQLDDGRRLTEGPAIVQWIADQAPATKLAPPNGTFERAQLQEWLNFIGTELHKQFSALFDKQAPAELKTAQSAKIHKRLAWVNAQLADGRQWLMGEYTVADGYLFTVTRWARHLKVDLTNMPSLDAWYERVGKRPAVEKALAAEGIRA